MSGNDAALFTFEVSSTFISNVRKTAHPPFDNQNVAAAFMSAITQQRRDVNPRRHDHRRGSFLIIQRRFTEYWLVAFVRSCARVPDEKF